MIPITLFDRYFGRAVVVATGAALLALLALLLFFALIAELSDVGRGDYTIGVAFLHVLLRMPRRAYEFFPAALLIGALFSLGRLADHNELTVVRAAGCSALAIFRSVAKSAALLAVAAMAVGEWVLPHSERLAEQIRAAALGLDSGTMNVRGGLWLRDGETILNIRAALSDTDAGADAGAGANALGEVRIYRVVPGQPLRAAGRARRADYLAAERLWRLRGLRESRFSPAGATTTTQTETRLPAPPPEVLLKLFSIPPEGVSTRDLLRHLAWLRANGLETQVYAAELWRRFVYPLNIAALLFLVIPFLFGPLRGGGSGRRIFLGIMTGILFMLVNKTLQQAGLVYGLHPAATHLIAPTLFLGLSLLFVLHRSARGVAPARLLARIETRHLRRRP